MPIRWLIIGAAELIRSSHRDIRMLPCWTICARAGGRGPHSGAKERYPSMINNQGERR